MSGFSAVCQMTLKSHAIKIDSHVYAVLVQTENQIKTLFHHDIILV
jgi:hypothetical protein